MSDVFLLELSPGAQKLVVKMSSADAGRRALAMRFQSYKKEHEFYANPVPGMASTLPHCYFNFMTGDTYLLGLEYIDEPAPTYFNADLATKAAQNLARLHDYAPAHQIMGFEAGYLAAIDDLQAADMSALFSGEVLGLVNQYVSDPMRYLHLFTEQEQVPSHMDYRSDNLRLLADQLVFLDWGEHCTAPAGIDLASLLTTSVSQKDRARFEQLVFDEYLSARRSTDEDALLQSYQLGLLLSVYLPALMQQSGDTDNATRLAAQIQSALADHLKDLHSILGD